MKQAFRVQLALASVLSIGAAHAQSTTVGNVAAEAPIPAIQDWSSRSVIHGKPMTPDEFIATGRGAELEKRYRDPRYVAAVLRRIEAESPLSAVRAAPAREPAGNAAKSRSKCNDRRRGHCTDAPGTGGESTESALRDWSNVLGGGTGGLGGKGNPGMFPAKYNFDIFAAPSCSADYVVYTTNEAGASQVSGFNETYTSSFTADPGQGTTKTVTVGGAGPRQVVLTSHASSNTGANFLTAGVDNTTRASNLRDAVNRWTQQTGFTATSSGAQITITAVTMGDTANTAMSETLDNFTGDNSWAGTEGTGTAGQPTIIAFNQLYQDTTPPLDGCNGSWNQNGAIKAPNVMWSYTTGSGFVTETSPVLSYLDGGKQVAYVQRNGNTLQLVLLKGQTGQGTPGNPVTLTASANSAAYRACASNCFYAIPFSTNAGANNTDGGPTYSAPFVDYSGDILWVGDGNGILHKFADVFQGADPREITSGGFPKLVESGLKLSSPVFDYNGRVFVGTQSGAGTAGGKLHRILASNGTTEATSSKLALIGTSGVRESPIIDLRSGSVYAFVFNDNTTNYTDTAHCQAFNNEIDGCRAMFRFDRLFTDNTSGTRQWLGRGNSTTRTLYAGGFDDAFYNSTDGTGSMYITGGRATNTFYATLWKVPITAGAIGSPVVGPEIGVRDRYTNGDAGTGLNGSNDNLQNLSPVTVIKNPTSGFEYLYASTASWGNATGCGNGTYAGGACLYMYRLDQSWATTLAPTAALPVTAGNGAAPATQVPGGTGGIVVDNVSLAAGASQIYFSNTGTTGNAVQASQSALD